MAVSGRWTRGSGHSAAGGCVEIIYKDRGDSLRVGMAMGDGGWGDDQGGRGPGMIEGDGGNAMGQFEGRMRKTTG